MHGPARSNRFDAEAITVVAVRKLYEFGAVPSVIAQKRHRLTYEAGGDDAPGLADSGDRVAIIEKGELLATGSVDEIQQDKRKESQRGVVVRALSEPDAVSRFLDQQDDTRDIRLDGQLVHFTHSGSRSDEARLLRKLIEANFEIAEFRSRQKSLEDVFMEVTQGIVQ